MCELDELAGVVDFGFGLVVSALATWVADVWVADVSFLEAVATAFVGASFLAVCALAAADKNNTAMKGKMYFFIIVFFVLEFRPLN